jgi:hypothetical protein
MRILMIDDEAKGKVAEVMAYARKNVYYPDDEASVPGDNPSFVCHLNTYRCVFTYTKSLEDGKLYRHLSVSVPSDGYPSPEAMCSIAGLFEFTGASKGILARIEDGKWMMHVQKEEPHCIVLAEVLE